MNIAILQRQRGFWKTRWETSIDGSGTPYRTLVCYKETHANAKIDPPPDVWTGTWRDPRFSPPADGGRPENALNGTIFTVNGFRNDRHAGAGRRRQDALLAQYGGRVARRRARLATLPDRHPGNRVGRGPRQRLPAAGPHPAVDDHASDVQYLQDYGTTYAPVRRRTI